MGVLMLSDQDSGTLHPVISEGLTDEQSKWFDPQRPGIGPVGVAFSEHRRVTVLDALAEGGADGDGMREIARGVGFRGMDVVPLTLGDGPAIGAFAMMFRSAHRPSARSGRLAEGAAHLVALAIDHARLRAEADRRRQHAEEMAGARVQFLARMSHELRTPLQSITGYIDLLRMGLPEKLTTRQVELLDRVRKSEQILISVIDDLIMFARLEAGAVVYELEAVTARDAMSISETVVSPLAQRRGITLEVAHGEAHHVARADSGKLKQVLINLLTNAVKYTPTGGTVRLTCRADDHAVYFDVSDTGPGIPAHKLQEVFHPYVQLAHPSTDGLGGSGLGLAISREFTSGMGGELTATSAVERGSVFTVRLQRHQQPTSEAAPQDATAVLPASPPAPPIEPGGLVQ